MLLSYKNKHIIPKPTFRESENSEFYFWDFKPAPLTVLPSTVTPFDQPKLQPIVVPLTVNNKELIVYSRRKKIEDMKNKCNSLLTIKLNQIQLQKGHNKVTKLKYHIYFFD